ncbi:hypothetical protein GPS47_03445 [Acinetobacter haemolyticus]|uniref:Uncharacterized protein n=1 Tax=Acinetobacter haemolyticus TaxID=29430 RepID=A0A372MQJ5_ACIHA|nr:hypothetical protein HMPREF0023_1889 [Acinetobacter sp. ATCC 27244]NAR50850.1 hypothetical protein [Acinetobacter haemolyticus]NAR54075.1 hypothetical protein [Acinetobacter haemolyticus]NAR57996.1 hypothetical protein [Acinetobacter haemolyticus]NAR60432.1 hypothetical protein [Acinetobacter haemolyticus]
MVLDHILNFDVIWFKLKFIKPLLLITYFFDLFNSFLLNFDKNKYMIFNRKIFKIIDKSDLVW